MAKAKKAAVVKATTKAKAPVVVVPKKVDYSTLPLPQLAALPSWKPGQQVAAIAADKDHDLKAGEKVTIRNVGKVKGTETLFYSTKGGRKTSAPLALFLKRGDAPKGQAAAKAEPVEPVYIGEKPPKGWKAAKRAKELFGKTVRLFRIDVTDGTKADEIILKAHLGAKGKAGPLVPDAPDKIQNTVLVRFGDGAMGECLLEEVAVA